MPSRVAAIQGITGCLTLDWTAVMARPVLRTYQARLRSSVATPSWTMRFAERSYCPASPRFSCHSRIRAFSSCPSFVFSSIAFSVDSDWEGCTANDCGWLTSNRLIHGDTICEIEKREPQHWGAACTYFVRYRTHSIDTRDRCVN
jgi:hypothetical protein